MNSTLHPKWREILASVVPVKAGCYSCAETWSGRASRVEALAHKAATGHGVWIESKPAEPVAAETCGF